MLKTYSSCVLYRIADNCSLIDCPEELNDDTSGLVSITKLEDSFTIHQSAISSSSQLWVVLRFLPASSYEVTEGDIFKLGRMALRVKKICESLEVIYEGKALATSPGEKSCKICCSDEDFENDPLISPCNCSGSLKYIHFVCLKNWLQSKVTTRCLGPVSVYQFSDFICELCKQPLPEFFQFRGKCLSLLEIKYPSSPYIILEEIKPEETHNQTLYVVGLDEGGNIMIGRGTDSDIKLTDISVSRHHARIKYSKGKFFIQDNKSKFGTLIGICKSISVLPGHEITLQINRTVATFCSKKPWSCCKGQKVFPLQINNKTFCS